MNRLRSVAGPLRAGIVCALSPLALYGGDETGCEALNVTPRDGLNARDGDEKRLLFAIPKKGRLYEKVKEMLKGAGIDYKRPDRVDIAKVDDLNVSLVFLPAADIATYVGEGDVDLGITGQDIVAESEVDVNVVMNLGFGACRLSLQAPVAEQKSVESLAGKRIVTSFPNLTKAFFKDHEREDKTHVKCISGSVEAACGLGLADGIVDLVETGTTMRAAGLEEVCVIMRTQTVLIANPQTQHPELVEVIRKRIAGYLTANRYVMVTYNCPREKLDAVKKITPGKNSPSIMPLERDGWLAISALVPKKTVAGVMDELERVGATDILLQSIMSSRMGD